MTRKTSILAFGARKDAGTWESQCRALGLDIGRVIRKANPTQQELREFFEVPAHWLYLGGHFGSLLLLNDREDSWVKFRRESVTIRAEGQAAELTKKAKAFRLHESCEVVLWGGCSVCEDRATIETLRVLFGPHVLLGFAGLTGWKMVDAMLGAGFITKGHFFDNVAKHTGDFDAIVQAWMNAAKKGYGGGDMENRFRCIDRDGREWKLEKGRIRKGRKF